MRACFEAGVPWVARGAGTGLSGGALPHEGVLIALSWLRRIVEVDLENQRNLLQPEAAFELGKRKAANLLATGAEAIAGGNPGCTLQIASHLQAAGRPLPLYHPVELVRMSIEGGNGAGGS